MKRAKKLFLLLAVLVIVIAGYAVVSRLLPQEDAADPNDESAEPITVAVLDASSVSKITWSYEGETIALTRYKKGWQYQPDERFPLDQSKVESMLSAVADVKATRALEEASDLSEYGLDDPGCTISILTSDGSEKNFTLGSKNEVTDSYYLQVDGGSAVYTVDGSISSAFSYKLMDLVVKETIPYFSNIDSLTISTPEKMNKIVSLKSSEGITYTDAYKWFYEAGNEGGKGYSPLSTNKVTELKGNLTSLAWNSCADYSAEEEDLAAYGLQEPKVAITVEYSIDSDKSGKELAVFDLLIGNQLEEQSYAMIKGSDLVYLIDSAVVDAFLAADYESLRPDDVCLMNWDTVDSMEVTIDGVGKMLTFDRQEDGTVTYAIDGTAADPEKVETFLNSLTSLNAADDTENASGGAAEVTVVFHRNTQYFKTMTFKLSRYDSSYYLVDFIGQKRLLVRNSAVQSLKTAFIALTQ